MFEHVTLHYHNQRKELIMKEVIKKVRHKQKIVAEVTVPLYENVQEIIDSEPPERIVAVFNNGNHVRIMGNERSKFSTSATSKKVRTKIAFELLSTEELMAVAQDADALQAKLESDEMQARVNAYIAEQATNEPPDEPVDAA